MISKLMVLPGASAASSITRSTDRVVNHFLTSPMSHASGSSGRRLGALTILMLVVVSLAGCGSNVASSGPGGTVPGALTARQIDAEYRAEEHKLPPLPSGMRWNKPNFASTTDGSEQTYGPGEGTQYADEHWACVWEGVLLRVAPTSKRYKHDISALGKFKTTYVYRTQSGVKQPFDQEYQQAQLGDTSGFSQDYEANCT